MKVRNGFVSNSSSSSFIVALPKKVKCKCCGKKNEYMLWVLRDLIKNVGAKNNFDSTGLSNYAGGAAQLFININEEIKELKKDIYWCNKERKILEKILQNKDAIDLCDSLETIRHSPRHDRLTRSYRDSTAEGLVLGKIENLNDTMGKASKEIARLVKKARVIKQSAKNKDTIFTFEMDNTSEYYCIIENLIQSKDIILIKKETT